MAEPRRILHVITGLGVGGAEQQLLATAPRSRHAVEVATVSGAGPVGEQLRDHGITVHELEARWRADPKPRSPGAHVEYSRMLTPVSPYSTIPVRIVSSEITVTYCPPRTTPR